MNMIIQPINLFKDNYCWALSHEHSLWVVDPGDPDPIIDFAKKHHLTLSGILVTHHHHDHCGGIAALSKYHSVTVYGPAHENIPATHIIHEGDEIYPNKSPFRFKVIYIPGHTLEHVAYYCATESLLFCGDTLFSGGCGRVFEGTHEQMYQSLHRLTALPDETAIYCGHEYTFSNLMFAKHIEPDNPEIDTAILRTQACLAQGIPSLPSTLLLEKKINPFLRSHIPAVMRRTAQIINKQINNPIECFAELRILKDQFM